MHDHFSIDDQNTVPHNRPVTSPDPQPEVEETLRSSPAPDAPPSPLMPPQVNAAPVPAPAPMPYYNRGFTPPPPPPPPNRQSDARDRMRRRRVRPNSKGSEWAWVVIAGAMLAAVVVISMSVTLLLRTIQQPQGEIIPTAPSIAELPTPVDLRSDFSNYTGGALRTGQEVKLDDGRSIVLEPWNGTSRVTILVMGLDRRPGERGLSYRTDTMMLLSLDPATQSIGVLSIPRDLYVEVPGYGQLQRINTPMVLGELQRPGLGPQLAMQTVQYNFGIRVHDYVVIDFNGVISLIDLIGGVDINVKNNISDPQYPNMYYGYDPLYIRAGLQHFDGTMALKYARTRHGSSDFQRAQRQQDVIFAVRQKILDLDMLPQLIVQAPSLLNALENNLYTGMSVDQIIQLAWTIKDVPQENIRTGVVSQQYVTNYTTGDGAAVLVPNRSMLGALMVDVFGANYSE